MIKSLKHIEFSLVMAFVTLWAATTLASTTQGWVEEKPTTLVGRITHVEGSLARYDASLREWTDTYRDAPVGRHDRLHTEAGSRGELIMPNNTWIRMDGDTEIELAVLDARNTVLDMPFGNVRLYNKSNIAQIKAITPYGKVVVPEGAIVDIYVFSNGAEVISLKKHVIFQHTTSASRHRVQASGEAVFANKRRVRTTLGDVPSAWDTWNRTMNRLWAVREGTRGESVTYLPSALHYDAYTLDAHGRWELVYYKGTRYRFWRPVHVHSGWTPFSTGVWRVWWDDHVWIPREPFGYITHHYGNWIFTAGHWYWAPPVTRKMVRAGLPLLHIGVGWYPGRVAWVHTDVHIGWFPLAPHEPYYTHRRWGRRSIVVAKGSRYGRHRHHYKHRRHAMVIHRDHFYGRKSYRDTRARQVSHVAIAKKFRPAYGPESMDIKRYRNTRDRANGRKKIVTPKRYRAPFPHDRQHDRSGRHLDRKERDRKSVPDRRVQQKRAPERQKQIQRERPRDNGKFQEERPQRRVQQKRTPERQNQLRRETPRDNGKFQEERPQRRVQQKRAPEQQKQIRRERPRDNGKFQEERPQRRKVQDQRQRPRRMDANKADKNRARKKTEPRTSDSNMQRPNRWRTNSARQGDSDRYQTKTTPDRTRFFSQSRQRSSQERSTNLRQRSTQRTTQGQQLRSNNRAPNRSGNGRSAGYGTDGERRSKRSR